MNYLKGAAFAALFFIPTLQALAAIAPLPNNRVERLLGVDDDPVTLYDIKLALEDAPQLCITFAFLDQNSITSSVHRGLDDLQVQRRRRLVTDAYAHSLSARNYVNEEISSWDYSSIGNIGRVNILNSRGAGDPNACSQNQFAAFGFLQAGLDGLIPTSDNEVVTNAGYDQHFVSYVRSHATEYGINSDHSLYYDTNYSSCSITYVGGAGGGCNPPSSALDHHQWGDFFSSRDVDLQNAPQSVRREATGIFSLIKIVRNGVLVLVTIMAIVVAGFYIKLYMNMSSSSGTLGERRSQSRHVKTIFSRDKKGALVRQDIFVSSQRGASLNNGQQGDTKASYSLQEAQKQKEQYRAVSDDEFHSKMENTAGGSVTMGMQAAQDKYADTYAKSQASELEQAQQEYLESQSQYDGSMEKAILDHTRESAVQEYAQDLADYRVASELADVQGEVHAKFNENAIDMVNEMATDAINDVMEELQEKSEDANIGLEQRFDRDIEAYGVLSEDDEAEFNRLHSSFRDDELEELTR